MKLEALQMIAQLNPLLGAMIGIWVILRVVIVSVLYKVASSRLLPIDINNRTSADRKRYLVMVTWSDRGVFDGMIIKLGEVLGRGGFVRLAVLALFRPFTNLHLSGNGLPCPRS